MLAGRIVVVHFLVIAATILSACGDNHGVADRIAIAPDLVFDAAIPLTDAAPLDVAAPLDAALPLDFAPPTDLTAPDFSHPDLSVAGACSAALCIAGQVCELGTCHKDCGKGGLRCGSPEACCQAGQVCYQGACTTPGRSCGVPTGDAGACSTTACPMGQYCDTVIGKCLPDVGTSACLFHPPTGAFSPVVKWEWTGSTTLPTYNQVMMTPMVGDLDGNCVPDVVFSTFSGGEYTKDGVLRAVRGDGGGALFTVTDPALRTIPGAQLAIADVDGDGRMEIFACHEDTSGTKAGGALMSFRFDGTRKWVTTVTPCNPFDAPWVADVDHDGNPEVGVGFTVFNANTGAFIATGGGASHGYYSVPIELDGNAPNGLEIVGGNLALHWNGAPYWDNSGGASAFPAVADLDGDGSPDVVSVAPGAHTVTAYKHDGTLLWGPVDVNATATVTMGPSGGGPPTIADFDGNGKPDVGVAGGYGYLVLNGQTGKTLWQSTATRDYSSRVTGSSVFDFEGDGAAEAIYNDELNLRVYDGATGKELLKLCSTSGTLYENPIVVDVDGDDHAEIVVMDNNYAFKTCDDVNMTPSHTGFHVIGDAMNRWVRTRRIWNQHAYHIANIDDDGRVPKSEAHNWQTPALNNFRQNLQTRGLLNAPDLIPAQGKLHGAFDRCGAGQILLVGTVANQGAAGAPAGVPVAFYSIDSMGRPTFACGTMTSEPILPGAVTVVSCAWTPPGGNLQGPYTVIVTVDDDGTRHGIVNECDETNNQSYIGTVACP